MADPNLITYNNRKAYSTMDEYRSKISKYGIANAAYDDDDDNDDISSVLFRVAILKLKLYQTGIE